MYNKVMQLPDKQLRFVSEYLVDLNGAGAAVRAGYSRNSAKEQACRLLTYAHVRVEIQKRFKETEARLQLTRDDVIKGLLGAAQEARAAGNPMATISAWREVGRLMGFYNQPVTPALQELNDDQVRAMTDKELKALI
jgi:phage terminase small subunit